MFGKKVESPDREFFTIFDTKVGVYRDPILSINRFDILRSIDAMFRDPKAANDPLVVNAEDFQLFKVGEYDRKTGTILGCPPEHIANLHDLKATFLRSQTAQQSPLGPVGISAT